MAFIIIILESLFNQYHLTINCSIQQPTVYTVVPYTIWQYTAVFSSPCYIIPSLLILRYIIYTSIPYHASLIISQWYMQSWEMIWLVWRMYHSSCFQVFMWVDPVCWPTIADRFVYFCVIGMYLEVYALCGSKYLPWILSFVHNIFGRELVIY